MELVKIERLRIDIQDPTGSWNEFGFLSSQEDINWFTPSDSYWELEHRPIVGQYFEERGEYWSPAQTRVALPHWFGHLLPEGMLRELVAQRLAVHESRDFQLLRALGEDDLPGALRAISVAPDGSDASVGEHLADETADPYDLDFKFSLAGVQLKFSVFASARAITLPVKGQAGNGILKTPDPRPGFKNVPESEYAVMNLARLAGMQVAPTRLVTVTEILSPEYWSGAGSTTGLLIDRFDRTSENQRIHAEQFAQVMWIPARRDGAKYQYANFETVANLVSGVVGIDAVAEVIDRIVLNVLVGNGDAHLKNWSFIYPDGRNAKLSPAYDIVPTVLYVRSDDLGLKIDGSRAFDSVTSRSFERMGAATEFGATAARAQADEAIHRIMEHWHLLREWLDRESFDNLNRRLKSLPLVQRRSN